MSADVVRHAYRCGAYLTILADPVPGETLADVDRRASVAVRVGALTCTCYRRDENAQVATAIVDPRPSRPHVWGPGEQAEYDSLRARARTLYDNLRTQFDWTHADAFARAAAEFGQKGTI